MGRDRTAAAAGWSFSYQRGPQYSNISINTTFTGRGYELLSPAAVCLRVDVFMWDRDKRWGLVVQQKMIIYPQGVWFIKSS